MPLTPRKREKSVKGAVDWSQRHYLGDMDTYDIPIRIILYGDQEVEAWSHFIAARASGKEPPVISVPRPREVQWELLVEGLLRWTGQLDGFLTVYGAGWDEGESSRFSKPEAVATHDVCFLPLEGSTLKDCIGGREILFPKRGLLLDEFVSLDPHPWYNWKLSSKTSEIASTGLRMSLLSRVQPPTHSDGMRGATPASEGRTRTTVFSGSFAYQTKGSLNPA